MKDDNVTIARRWFDEIFEKGYMETLDDIVAENIKIHGAGDSEATGRESFRTWLRWYRETFVESKWEITLLFEAGNKVVTRYRGTSTYKGGFVGIPSNNQLVTETGIIIFNIVDNKVVEIWCEYSDIQVLEQLGVFPPKTVM